MLAEIMGSEQAGRARHFNGCRSKRNVTDYDRAIRIREFCLLIRT